MPKKGKDRESSTSYRRLAQVQEDHGRVPKGFVPILVGREPTSAERVLVRVNQFKDPRVAVLLEMTELELGCRPQGVLRITCDADHFRRVISKAR